MANINGMNGRRVDKATDLASFTSLGEMSSDRSASALNGHSTPAAEESPSASSPASNIRVMLAEDHVLVRAGIRALLQSLPGVEVMGEASNAAAALNLIEAGDVPDVAILDVSMKGMSGLELAARITKNHSQVRVIILSMHASEEYVQRALQNGASGYLLKDSSSNELEIALRAVSRGEIYLSASIAQNALSSQRSPTASPTVLLTPRQQEILILLAQGLPNGQIAQRLCISVKTVETHRAQLMSRLNIFDVAGLVRYAIRTGLIGAD